MNVNLAFTTEEQQWAEKVAFAVLEMLEKEHRSEPDFFEELGVSEAEGKLLLTAGAILDATDVYARLHHDFGIQEADPSRLPIAYSHVRRGGILSGKVRAWSEQEYQEWLEKNRKQEAASAGPVLGSTQQGGTEEEVDMDQASAVAAARSGSSSEELTPQQFRAALSTAILAWMGEHGYDNKRLSAELEVPWNVLKRVVYGESIVEAEDYEYYARIYRLTRLPQSRPTIIPGRPSQVGPRDNRKHILIHRAWTEQRLEEWLALQEQPPPPTFAQDLMHDLREWIPANRGTSLTVFAHEAGIPLGTWHKIIHGEDVLNTEHYANIHRLSRLPLADPCTLPPIWVAHGKGFREVKRAWSEQEYQEWLEKKSENPEDGEDVDSAPASLGDESGEEEEPSEDRLPPPSEEEAVVLEPSVPSLSSSVGGLVGGYIDNLVHALSQQIGAEISRTLTEVVVLAMGGKRAADNEAIRAQIQQDLAQMREQLLHEQAERLGQIHNAVTSLQQMLEGRAFEERLRRRKAHTEGSDVAVTLSSLEALLREYMEADDPATRDQLRREHGSAMNGVIQLLEILVKQGVVREDRIRVMKEVGF